MNRAVRCFAALAAAAAVGLAQAQGYPAKPIKIIVPFVPGGPSDTVGRAIGSKFQEYVPFKGGAAVVTDLLGGQVDASFQNLGTVATQVKAGKLRALAVTAKSRAPTIPDVPTMAEAGYPELVVTSWQAAGAPIRTPREVVAKLNDAAVKALRSAEIRERLNGIGFDVVAGTPAEFGQFMKAEVERWTAVVQRGNIQPN